MRVDYQLASHTPVTAIAVLVDGVVVATQAGTDLTDSGGLWFAAPSAGSHPLAVQAVNVFGCERVATAFLPVVIK
jgi:hypothetical protein